MTWSEAQKFLLDHAEDLNQTMISELTKIADRKEDYTLLLATEGNKYEFKVVYGENSGRTQLQLKGQKRKGFNYEVLLNE